MINGIIELLSQSKGNPVDWQEITKEGFEECSKRDRGFDGGEDEFMLGFSVGRDPDFKPLHVALKADRDSDKFFAGVMNADTFEGVIDAE